MGRPRGIALKKPRERLLPEEFLTFMQDEVAQRLKQREVATSAGRERDVVDSGPAGLETAKGAGARDPIATMGLIARSK